MNRERMVTLLAQISRAAAAWHPVWHPGGGWFCDRCNVDCGAMPDSLCPCCAIAYDALADSGASR